MPSYEERRETIKALSEQEYFDARLKSQQKGTESVRIGSLRGDTGRYEVMRDDGGITGNGVKTFNSAPPQDGFVRGLIPRNGQAIALDSRNRKEIVVIRQSEQVLTNNIISLSKTDKEIAVLGDRPELESVYTLKSNYELGATYINKTGSGIDDWIITATLSPEKALVIIGGSASESSLPKSLENIEFRYTVVAHGLIWEWQANLTIVGDTFITLPPVDGAPITPPREGCRDPYASNFDPAARADKAFSCTYTPQSLKGRIALKVTSSNNIQATNTEPERNEIVSYLVTNDASSDWNALLNPAAPRFEIRTNNGTGKPFVRYLFNGSYNDYSSSANGDIISAEIIYGEGTRGCTIFGCSNHNPSATIDDGTCDFTGYTGTEGDYFPNVDTTEKGLFVKFSGIYLDSRDIPTKAFSYVLAAAFTQQSFPSYDFRAGLPLGLLLTPQSAPIFIERVTGEDVNAVKYFGFRFFVDGELSSFYARSDWKEVDFNVINNANFVYGCTDDRANNFNSSANIDDGSCSFDPTRFTYTKGSETVKIQAYVSSATNNETIIPTTTEIIGSRDSTAQSTTIQLNIFKNKTISSEQIFFEKFVSSNDPKVVATERLLVMGLNQASCLVRSFNKTTGVVKIKFFTELASEPIILDPKDFVFFIDSGVNNVGSLGFANEAFVDLLFTLDIRDGGLNVNLIGDTIYCCIEESRFSGNSVDDSFLSPDRTKTRIITGVISASGVDFSSEVDETFVALDLETPLSVVFGNSYFPPD